MLFFLSITIIPTIIIIVINSAKGNDKNTPVVPINGGKANVKINWKTKPLPIDIILAYVFLEIVVWANRCSKTYNEMACIWI